MSSDDEASKASEASSFENGLEICDYSKSMKGRLILKRKRKVKTKGELQTKHRKEFEQKCNGAAEAKEQIRAFENAAALDKSDPSKKSTKADGVIASLIGRGCSEKVLRSVLGIGSGRYSRVRDNKRKQLAPGINGNHLTEEDIERLIHFFKTIPTEEGYPCAHRKIKHYIIEQAITWMKFWQRYRQNMEAKHFRAMSYVRFIETVCSRISHSREFKKTFAIYVFISSRSSLMICLLRRTSQKLFRVIVDGWLRHSYIDLHDVNVVPRP
jgi:hypothetical protein